MQMSDIGTCCPAECGFRGHCCRSHMIFDVTSGVKYGSRNKQVGNKQIQHQIQCKIWRWKQRQASREETNLIGNLTGATLKYSQGEMRHERWG